MMDNKTLFFRINPNTISERLGEVRLFANNGKTKIDSNSGKTYKDVCVHNILKRFQ